MKVKDIQGLTESSLNSHWQDKLLYARSGSIQTYL